MVKTRDSQTGQAMVELLIVATFVLVPLFLAIPLVGKYLDMRAAAAQSARYAAWERTVWYGGNAASSMGWFGVNRRWQAVEKSDAQIRNEVGVRYLSQNTTNAFSSADRSETNFRGGTKEIWKDRKGQAFLANYDDIQNNVGNSRAPGTLNVVLNPVANFASTLGPFVLEMNGKYSATVSMQVRDIDTNHFLAKNSKLAFSETNVLLANGWNANGPSDEKKTSAKQQVKGLVPFSIFTTKIAGIPVMDYLQTAVSVFLPEISKLELGKIEPDVVPPDRVK